MRVLEILSAIIGISSLVFAIFTYKKDISRKKRLKQIELMSTSLFAIAKSLKRINESEISFELEREIRRIVLFLSDDSKINSSLLWFTENKNNQDVEFISKAMKLKCFRTKPNKVLANDIIRPKGFLKNYNLPIP